MSHRNLPRALPLLALIGAALAGLVLYATPAAAADLDPGYADVPQQMPEQQVTFGSGWYVRGDLAVTKDYDLGVVQPPNSILVYRGLSRSDRIGYDASLGGGYAFTNSFRGDVVVDFHQPITTIVYPTYCFNSAAATCDSNGGFHSYDALANGYYDIGTWGPVTPYIGAGVGVGFGQVKTLLVGGTSLYTSSLVYQNLAWALMAGVAVDVYQHVKLDIGYRYLNDGSVLGSKIYYHEVRAGLRYMIDN